MLEPAATEVLVGLSSCDVCRTNLGMVGGDLDPHRCPVVPGHEVIGTVAGVGVAVSLFQRGDRVGVACLRSTCGQ